MYRSIKAIEKFYKPGFIKKVLLQWYFIKNAHLFFQIGNSISIGKSQISIANGNISGNFIKNRNTNK
jgi:hypothetical protein